MFLRNFVHLLFQAFKLLVVLAIMRALCLIFIRDELHGQPLERAFLMGIRFDWLVISFLLIIPWVLLLLIQFTSLPRKWSEGVLRLYWRVISGLAVFVWAVNIFYFSHQRSWMWLAPWKARLQNEPWLTLAILICVFLVLWIYKNSKLSFWRIELRYASGKKLLNIITAVFCALVIGLGARGTLTPHHLEFQHSQMTTDPYLNNWILSPLWTMTKGR